MTAIINNACPVEAYDNLTQAKEILNWIEAINWASGKTLEAGQTWRAKHLAALGQYLASEWAGHFDNEALELSAKHGLEANQ